MPLPDNYAEAQAEARSDKRLEAREYLRKAWLATFELAGDTEATFENLYDELCRLLELEAQAP